MIFPHKQMTVQFLLILALFCSEAKSQALTIYTENGGYDNYIDVNGETTGHNADIVKEIMARLGKTDPIIMAPWARGYAEVQKKANVALFSTTRTREREKLFKWVGPLNVSKYALFKKKDSTLKILSIEDAKKVNAIGCYKSDFREDILIRNGFSNLESLFGPDAVERNFKKLLADRIDLWFASHSEIIRTVMKTGIDPNLIEEAFVVSKAYLYIAFSKETSDEIIETWQETLNRMKQDGTYEKILLKYPTGKVSVTYDSPGPALE